MSQEAAALETVLQDLKAKQGDLQSKLADANSLVKKTQQLGKLIADQSVKDEALLQKALDTAKTPAAKNAAQAKLNAFLTQTDKELADVQNEINNAKAILQAVQNDVTTTNNSITRTEQQIAKEKASDGQVAPTPVDPAVAPAASNTQSFVTTAAPAAIPNTPSFTGISSPTFGDVAPQEIGIGVGAVPVAGYSTKGLLNNTRSDAAKAVEVNQATQVDWRVKLTLAPEANAKYLYNVAQPGDILFPLKQTKGVIFPYTPGINVQYIGGYSPAEIVHSNYKIFQYKGSSVDQVTITCDFTAQDTSEANYLLAVIHFFRSVTKMFYGNDQNPNPGVPPPLCYLTGLGQFQFNNHALVVSGFTYDLPTDVDYIRASAPTTVSGTPLDAYNQGVGAADTATNRTAVNGVPIGGKPAAPMFRQSSTYLSNSNVTYVPTKMKMTITCLPVVSRNQVSNDFSLRDYATGKLLRRGFW
jgi:hypothetical protein